MTNEREMNTPAASTGFDKSGRGEHDRDDSAMETAGEDEGVNDAATIIWQPDEASIDFPAETGTADVDESAASCCC